MAAGYGIARMTANVRWKPLTATLIAVAFLAFPTISALWNARTVYHLWPNTSALAARVEPLLKTTNGPVLTGASGQPFILEYDTPQGHDWARWMDFDTPYTELVKTGRFALVVMEFDSTLNSAQLPRQAVTGSAQSLSAEILRLSTYSDAALVREVEQSGHYQLQDVIPFSTSDAAKRSGLFAVWKRVG
jgi:hypothetical protein